jgi:hypothetical protein
MGGELGEDPVPAVIGIRKGRHQPDVGDGGGFEKRMEGVAEDRTTGQKEVLLSTVASHTEAAAAGHDHGMGQGGYSSRR